MTKKVIIIDDSSTALNLLKTTFESYLWEVYTAKSCDKAYEMIFDVAPDLIITDAIMPVVGGFQLVKSIRKNEKISKIPVIVYSVLPEKNAKFYIKEDSIEYFLTKDDNYDELMKLAEEITKKYPLSDKYKEEILDTKKEAKEEQNEEIIIEQEVFEEETETILNLETLEKDLKEKLNHPKDDKEFFFNLFSFLYQILNYDLSIIHPYSDNKNSDIYFDIKDIILSRLFQNFILNKYKASNSTLFKKYAPNLKTISSEEDFLTKLEMEFEYKNSQTASVTFYSQANNKWQNQENIETIKQLLNKLFKNRYINKSSNFNKKEEISKKYSLNKPEMNLSLKLENETENSYIGILDIINFADLKNNLTTEELDIVNSKISEKIINYIDKNEHVYKNDEDEYIIIIYAKNENRAAYKFNCIVRLLEEISYNTFKIESTIGASSCIIDNVLNINEAEKTARIALEFTNSTDKVVVQ